MPPPSPTQTIVERPTQPLALICRVVRIAGAGGLLCCLIASLASADDPTRSESPPPKAAPVLAPRSAAPPSPLRPQTRYTVRKQIESIEPVSWLERYGTVRIRDLSR